MDGHYDSTDMNYEKVFRLDSRLESDSDNAKRCEKKTES